MRISFSASRTHWLDHLAPVYKALADAGHQVVFHTPGSMRRHARRRGIAPDGTPIELAGELVVVASRHDYRRAVEAKLDVVYMAHGNGQSFVTGEHRGYAGGPGLDRVVKFLAVNEHNAAAWRRTYPKVPIDIIGCPRLDRLAGLPPKVPDNPPVVALSFHWDPKSTGNRLRETWTAWTRYKTAVERIAQSERPYQLLGHGHPRIARKLRPWYERLGIEWVGDIEQILDRADVYINDCSSTLYEFAATDRPVVVLNIPAYRREIEHGQRFWEHADVGVQCDRPRDLDRSIREALTDPTPDRRREIVEEVYPNFGSATAAAVKAIEGVIHA